MRNNSYLYPTVSVFAQLGIYDTKSHKSKRLISCKQSLALGLDILIFACLFTVIN